MFAHHLAIQTSNLENSIRWYERFFGASLNWDLDRFSETTRTRLPGIRKLAELQASHVRFHIFERAGVPPKRSDISLPCFQHVCLELESIESMKEHRSRWIELFESGDYAFASDEMPTEIEWDGTKSASFYLLDVNGVEFELTWFANTSSENRQPDLKLGVGSGAG